MAHEGADEEQGELEPLRFAPKARPPAWIGLIHALLALAVILVASRVFVAQLEHVLPGLSLAP